MDAALELRDRALEAGAREVARPSVLPAPARATLRRPARTCSSGRWGARPPQSRRRPRSARAGLPVRADAPPRRPRLCGLGHLVLGGGLSLQRALQHFRSSGVWRTPRVEFGRPASQHEVNRCRVHARHAGRSPSSAPATWARPSRSASSRPGSLTSCCWTSSPGCRRARPSTSPKRPRSWPTTSQSPGRTTTSTRPTRLSW